MQMIAPSTLADACLEAVSRQEDSAQPPAAVILMYGVDPASPWVVVYPLPIEDLEEAVASGADLRTVLNPAEHREELELALHFEEGTLPGGDELASLVAQAARLLRNTMPETLVCATDPERTALLESVREQRIPEVLSFLPKS